MWQVVPRPFLPPSLVALSYFSLLLKERFVFIVCNPLACSILQFKTGFGGVLLAKDLM